MQDYSPDEATLKNDKKKIAILISIIVFVIILIVLFVIVVILDINKSDESKKLSTTTRRTVNVEESSNNETTNNIVNEDETTTTTSMSVNSTSKTKVSNSSGTKVITSTKISTSTSIKVVDILPPTVSHDVVTDKSTYPDSLDDWEWQIVNLINAERRKKGLNELLVAKDLRQLAEEAADLWLGSGTDVVKEYLTGHSNYRKYSNYDDVTAVSLYNDTVAATKVATNSALRYLGVGVLYKNDTYYYVIVYE